MTDYTQYGMRWEAGALLPASVEQALNQLSTSFCDITGFGELAWVVLQFGEDKESLFYEGPLQLIDLKGRLRQAGDVLLSDLVCTVSRLTDNGVQVLGGKLKEAEVSFLELTFTPLKESEIPPAEVANDEAPKGEETKPLPPAGQNRFRPDEKPADKGALPDRWAKAVLESKRVERESHFLDDGASDVRPKRGDIVQHRQFGECKVTRIGDDHVTLRKPDGRHVQLGLPILRFTETGEQNGRAVYRVEVQTKR